MREIKDISQSLHRRHSENFKAETFCIRQKKRKKEWEKDILTVQPDELAAYLKKNYYSPLRTAKEECLQQRRSVQ